MAKLKKRLIVGSGFVAMIVVAIATFLFIPGRRSRSLTSDSDRFCPPASATNSGLQCPAQNGGSIHSSSIIEGTCVIP